MGLELESVEPDDEEKTADISSTSQSRNSSTRNSQTSQNQLKIPKTSSDTGRKRRQSSISQLASNIVPDEKAISFLGALRIPVISFTNF